MGNAPHTDHALFHVTRKIAYPRFLRLLATALLLLLTFWLAVSSLSQKSPTFDEQGFIVRGLAYLRDPAEGGTRRIRVGHPPGLNAYNALLLAGDDTVHLPADDPSWQGTGFHRPAELFLWEIGNDVEHIMFLARIPTVWLGLLLIALVSRWAAEMAGSGLWRRKAGSSRLIGSVAGLLALVVTAFDPNLMAHMRLATTDFGLTATAAFAGYGLWRLVRRPSWWTAVLAGVGLGFMLNTKFTALLFLPLFGVVLIMGLIIHWHGRSGKDRSSSLVLTALMLLIYPLVGLVVLWAGNGFDVGNLPTSVPFLPQLGGARTPLALYLEQLLDIGGRLQVETPAFLLGHFRTSGWWYYFPLAFLLKTPLPTLLLLLWAVVSTVVGLWTARSRLTGANGLDLAALWIPAAGFFAIALTTDINLGYRHILPVLPFLYVFIGVSIAPALVPLAAAGKDPRRPSISGQSWLALGLTGALMMVSLWICPHYLAFFNVLAGGPDNGWRSLVDSNLDWGQDLQALGPWMRENDVDRVWLSYFGEARPEYYRIRYDGLDSFPPRLMNPEARPFVPSDPAPGWYAISATNLQGVQFFNKDQFSFFRTRRPDDKLGYSLFLYYVASHGEPVNLILSGLQPDEIRPASFAQLGTNDVTLRWVDGRQAMIVPQDGRPTWLFVDAGANLLPEWTNLLEGAELQATSDAEGNLLWRLPEALPTGGDVWSSFSLGDRTIDLLEPRTAVRDGHLLSILTTWQQRSEPAPVKIFIHLLDDDGAIVAQWDGLGAAWQGWRMGDVLTQQHMLQLPSDLPAGTYPMVAGLYDPQTLERWHLPDGAEFVELEVITIPE